MANSWSRRNILLESVCVCTKIIFSQVLIIFARDEVLKQTVICLLL